LIRYRRSVLWRARDICLAGGAGEQSVVADAVETLGQNVQQEAADEFIGRQRDRAKPLPSGAAIILVAKGYATLIESEEATVGYGDAVGSAFDGLFLYYQATGKCRPRCAP
jgi:phage tail tape-measure protein